MIKKTKQKTVKDFVFNDKHKLNVVSVSDDGKNTKFYNIELPYKISFKPSNYGSDKRYFDIDDTHINNTNLGAAKISLENINFLIQELSELKEIYEFVLNQGDVNFEREEKLKRLQ